MTGIEASLMTSQVISFILLLLLLIKAMFGGRNENP